MYKPWLICFFIIACSPASAGQHTIAGVDQDIVPICQNHPELCEPGPAHEIGMAAGDPEKKIIVPICQRNPILCIPGDDAQWAGVGVLTEDYDVLPKGVIVINPNDVLLGDGFMLIPQQQINPDAFK